MPNPSLRIIVLTLQQTSTVCRCVHGQPRGKWQCQAPAGQAFPRYAGAFSPSLPAEVVGRTPVQLPACSRALHWRNPGEHQASQGSCVELTNQHLTAGVLHVTGDYYWERHPPSEGERDAVFSTPLASSCNGKWLLPVKNISWRNLSLLGSRVCWSLEVPRNATHLVGYWHWNCHQVD